LVNTVFSQNKAGSLGGAMHVVESVPNTSVSLINCTISDNCGHGISNHESTIILRNSIVWGNSPEQFHEDTDGGPPLAPGASGAPSIFDARYCDIEGGWGDADSNNIDADPLFVQASSDNLRLSFGSPCVDRGDNGAIPEGITLDLAGQPRVDNGTVDLGAYEGEFEPLPPNFSTEVGAGEVAFMAVVGCDFAVEDLVSTLLMIFSITSDQESATVSMSEYSDTDNSNAGGFSELGTLVVVETSLPDGEFKNLIRLPFTEEELRGEDPLDVDLTYYDPDLDDWTLAVEANVQASPGHEGVVGTRIVTTGSAFTPSNNLGDYGVFWNPETRTGLVWAQLDHAGEFGMGEALCPADIAEDDVVNGDDLVALLAAWGSPGGPADVHPEGGDGIVNVNDLLMMLHNWGECPP
ncbi:MAG: hypothetical protein O7G85_10890, partial [Planctomycetota bacterium]|nr:hypothetical protein [Planctomycetota bacterium]